MLCISTHFFYRYSKYTFNIFKIELSAHILRLRTTLAMLSIWYHASIKRIRCEWSMWLNGEAPFQLASYGPTSDRLKHVGVGKNIRFLKDDIIDCIFVDENLRISIQISFLLTAAYHWFSVPHIGAYPLPFKTNNGNHISHPSSMLPWRCLDYNCLRSDNRDAL